MRQKCIVLFLVANIAVFSTAAKAASLFTDPDFALALPSPENVWTSVDTGTLSYSTSIGDPADHSARVDTFSGLPHIYAEVKEPNITPITTLLLGDRSDLPVCDGTASAPSCYTAADCTTCAAPGTCEHIACTNIPVIGTEHQACADTTDGTNWGSDMPCQLATCLVENAGPGDAAGGEVGGSCYISSTTTTGALTVTMHYEFNTSTAGNYNLWMRNVADRSWGPGEQIDCILTGVSGGSYSFSFLEDDLVNQRHGSGCGSFNYTGRYCWMAADGDSNAVNSYQPIPLDAGQHNLQCTATMNNTGAGYKEAGFDGIIFTTDTLFVPTETVAETCEDDFYFTSGYCMEGEIPASGSWWGPNMAPFASGQGYCENYAEPDGTLCSTGGTTCCSSTCGPGTPSTGYCP
jgi:hypothetical protein